MSMVIFNVLISLHLVYKIESKVLLSVMFFNWPLKLLMLFRHVVVELTEPDGLIMFF